VLHTCGAGPELAGRPQCCEVGVFHAEFSDELAQAGIVGVFSTDETQVGDVRVGLCVPIWISAPHVLIEKQQPR